jgi:hypothetical protein
MSELVKRAAAARRPGLVPMEAPEFGEGFVIHVRQPVLRDYDYVAQAVGDVEKAARLLARCACDETGKPLMSDLDVRELMGTGDALAVLAVAGRLGALVTISAATAEKN